MSSPRILVVDDEADIRGLLSEILAEEGYEIEVAPRWGEEDGVPAVGQKIEGGRS